MGGKAARRPADYLGRDRLHDVELPFGLGIGGGAEFRRHTAPVGAIIGASGDIGVFKVLGFSEAH